MGLEEWQEIIALTASISTILQFLTGIMVCQKFVEKGSTGNTSCFPFICGFLSCSLWLRYGFLINEESMILVNTIGGTLFLAYCMTYLFYSIKKSVVARQIFGVLCILIICIGYTTFIEEKHEIAVFRMGVLCCTTTVIFIAAPLATLMHVIKTKSTESLPFPMILSSCFVSLQWWLYGIILNDIFVQLPNFLGFALSIFQLGIFLCYPSTPTKTAGYNLVSHQF
ncbi:sugar transporter SWEET1 [Chrysoperla carnea]|uniref:sugar transporter SWEET1 n=1 Tax=Chrysoperla carnea TaxID=189513 RepID=UPI001D096EEC|nr:sugar transporter SWEET1 [Chrysoperla carnea]